MAGRIDEKVAWVREGAGGRFDDLELNAWLAVAQVTEDATAFAELVAPMFEAHPDDVLASPLTLIGSHGEIGERLLARREQWGYSYHVIPGTEARAFAPVVADLAGA
jgi:hypothetical protein